MLAYYLREESMQGENAYACPRCNSLQPAHRATAITQAPSHLILTLKRFKYDVAAKARRKLLTQVSLTCIV